MATAEKFSHIGCDGFPSLGVGSQSSIKSKLDITGTDDYGQTYQKWTTFSGVSDDSPNTSPELIEESRVLAMQYIWNLYSVQITAASSPVDISENGGEKTMNKWWELNVPPYEEDAGPYQPLDRGCIDAKLYTNYPYEYIENGIGSSLSENKGSGGGNNARFDFAFSNYVKKMYNGDVRNEDNFLGWGAAETDSYNVFNSGLGNYVNHLEVTSFAYYDNPEGYGDLSYIISGGQISLSGANTDNYPREDDSSNWKYEKVQVNGMWFIAWNYVSAWNNNTSTFTNEFTKKIDGVNVDFTTTITTTNTVDSNSVNATSFDSSISQTKSRVTIPPYEPTPDYSKTVNAAASASIGSFNYYTY
jgi:hypothetical protein